MSALARPPRLAAIRDELSGTTDRLHRLVDPLDETSWGRRPLEGKWSIARCVEHLNLTSRAYLPLFRNAFREARARGLTTSNPSYRIDFTGWMLLKSVEPPVRFPMRTPDAFVPPTIEPKERVVREYEDLQRQIASLLDEAADLALGRIRITSPFKSRVKYNAYAAFRLIPAHQRRHLWQAERVILVLSKQPR
jgi:hypothetical protein